MDPSQTWQRSRANQQYCQTQLQGLRNGGIYTPPGVHGSVMFPENLGGVNWGSTALDPATGILYANSNGIAFRARLIPRWGREQETRLLRNEIFDWANWGMAAGVVLLCGCLLRLLRRRSFLRGPVTLTLTAALMLVAILIARHQATPLGDSLIAFALDGAP